MTREQVIVAAARSYLGVRWVHQGRSREGLDCVGLPGVVARDHLKLTRLYESVPRDYRSISADEAMLEWGLKNLVRVKRSELRPGHIALTMHGSQRHVGIVGNYPDGKQLTLIHAYAIARQVVEARLDSNWRSLIIGAFAFPEDDAWPV